MTVAAAPPSGVRLWYEGARPKTLGAAISPVLVGTAVASLDGPISWWRALAALVVALSLQVAVNYANDYADGVRGTDANRRGPVRLVAGGLATPAAVKRASYIAFGVAAVVGAVLSIVVAWWLIPIGLVCIVAAATYTGGPKPYGYVGLGEVMVLVFFGFVATVGTTFVQHESVPAITWVAALAVGLPAVGILLANNLRDVETDRAAGKRTLAVRLGIGGSRALYVGAIAGALLAVVVCGIAELWALLGLVAAPLALGPVRLVRTRLDPPSLVRALIMTARFQLLLSALLALGFALA